MSDSTSGNDAQAILAKARAMLQQYGAPMTAENLNRASLALSRGETGMEPDNTMENAVSASLNEGRPTGGTVMTPVNTEQGNGAGTANVRVNAGAAEAASMNPLRDKVMATNPAQYNGTRADQPGQRDTQANLLRQTADGDADSVEAKVAGSLTEPTSTPDATVSPNVQQTSASAPQNGGPPQPQQPRPPLSDRVAAAADSPYMSMFTGGTGLNARSAAPLLTRLAGPAAQLEGPAASGMEPLAQRMMGGPGSVPQLAAPAERTMIPTRSAPPEVIAAPGPTVGPMQAAMMQGPGPVANTAVRTARRGTTGQRARQ